MTKQTLYKMKYLLPLALVVGCQSHLGAPRLGPPIGTTYYPYTDSESRSMGPGHFNCAWLNSELHWYIAVSDTFGDERVWSGPPCPNRGWGRIPDCSSAQKTCGVKVKLTCTRNCRADAPPVVAVITDACPKYHPSNIQDGACQGGPHFDISRDMWQLMHAANDNIDVTYEVMDPSAVLGPLR